MAYDPDDPSAVFHARYRHRYHSGTGRIVGESAALLFTAGSDYKLPKFTGVFGDNLAKLAHKAMESGGTLTIELYLQMQKGQYDNAFGIGCVLIIIVLILNLLTKLAANKLRRE